MEDKDNIIETAGEQNAESTPAAAPEAPSDTGSEEQGMNQIYTEPPYTQTPPGDYGQQPYSQQAYTPPTYVQRPIVGPPDLQNMADDPPYVQRSYQEQQAAYGQPHPDQQTTQQYTYGQPYQDQPSAQKAAYGQSYTQAQWQYGQPQGQTYGGASPYGQFSQAQHGQKLPLPPRRRRKEKKRVEGHRESSGGLGIGRANTAALVIIIIAACAVSGISGGLIGANMNTGGKDVSAPVVVGNNTPAVTIEPSNDITTTEAVAKKVLSSVVGITSTGTYLTEDYFWGPSEQEVSGVGTGMIIDTNGYILTNSHVVMDGSVTSISVLLSNGEEVDGDVVWNDTGLDLAVVKIEAEGLEPVELGNSDEVAIGSYVAAIGNPLGLEFSGSVTQGVVSGINRTIEVGDEMSGSIVTMQDLIQVDAAINSGNSGGPLLNSRGQVIGVNTAKASAEGMGFAIPINTAIPIVEKVINDGIFERVFMGVSAADIDVISENFPDVELWVETGACITDVNPGSPAEKAGLKVKDVIISVDGEEITGSDSLIKQLLGYESGDVITVVYNRGGEENKTEVTLLSQSEIDEAQVEENPFREPQRSNGER